jgi:ribonuclease T1
MARSKHAAGPARTEGDLESADVRRISRTRRPFLALVVLVLALLIGYAVRAATADHGTRSAHTDPVALSQLPPQAAATVARIRAGGPFPYPHNDGVVFHNAEHRLPVKPDGWYHEYTVPTPGSDDRGARRIVTGRDGRFWYTGDHYESFRRVDVKR